MNALALVLSYLASAFAFAIAGFSFFSGPGVRDVGGAVAFAVLGALMLSSLSGTTWRRSA
ncbi:MAG: hypothetical protein ACOC0P_02730 [Planctomycetota bacterium]